MYKGKPEETLITLCLAKHSVEKGEREKARDYLFPVVASNSTNPYRQDVVALYQSLDSLILNSPNDRIIGVMLPLSSIKNNNNKLPAEEVLDGIKFAVDLHNASTNNRIGLLIRDTKRDSSVIESIVKEFAEIKELKSVIGPLYSDECRLAAKGLSARKIPLFSPTATDEDLTTLYTYFWQTNPNFSTRGKVMAHYVFEQENRKKIAVIYSNEGYSSICARSFIREFTSLGGSVILEDKYSLNNPDFGKITNKIKSMHTMPEGVFAPVSDKKVVSDLLSAFVQAELVIPIYGNQDWFNAPGLETSSTLSNLLVFSSDYFLDFNDTAFTGLNEKFYRINGFDINRNVLYGYDAANLLIESLEIQSAIPPDGGMLRRMVFNGLHNDFSFRGSKVNSSLNIIRYQDGNYIRLTKLTLDAQ